MTDTVNVPREAVERFKDALENMPDVLERHTKGQKFNAYDLDDDGGSRAVCIGPITSRPLSLFAAPADVAELVEASLKLAANALAAAPKAEPSEAARIIACHLPQQDCPDTVCIPITITAGDLRRVYSAVYSQTEAPKVEQEPVGETYHARQIAEVMDEGDGFWRPCSGCQESVDGYVSETDYPYNKTFRCQPGGGCSECGGLGVVWDDTDYEQMAREMIADEARLDDPAPASDELLEALSDPKTVHLNMLRGGIAKLTPNHIGHLYRGDEAAEVVAEVMRQNPDAFDKHKGPQS